MPPFQLKHNTTQNETTHDITFNYNPKNPRIAVTPFFTPDNIAGEFGESKYFNVSKKKRAKAFADLLKDGRRAEGIIFGEYTLYRVEDTVTKQKNRRNDEKLLLEEGGEMIGPRVSIPATQYVSAPNKPSSIVVIPLPTKEHDQTAFDMVVDEIVEHCKSNLWSKTSIYFVLKKKYYFADFNPETECAPILDAVLKRGDETTKKGDKNSIMINFIGKQGVRIFLDLVCYCFTDGDCSSVEEEKLLQWSKLLYNHVLNYMTELQMNMEGGNGIAVDELDDDDDDHDHDDDESKKVRGTKCQHS